MTIVETRPVEVPVRPVEVPGWSPVFPEGFGKPPKLRAEWKARWVEVLRSGRYRQAFGILRGMEGDNNYCAVGVLQHRLWVEREIAYFGQPSRAPFETPPTPQKVMVGAIGHPYRHVIYLNDELRWSFERIADWIDEHM